jgi:hypothetical protein
MHANRRRETKPVTCVVVPRDASTTTSAPMSLPTSSSQNSLLWRNRGHRPQQHAGPISFQRRADTTHRIKMRPVSRRAVIWLACLYVSFYSAGLHIVKRADSLLGSAFFLSFLGASNLGNGTPLTSSLNDNNDESLQDEVETFALSEHFPGIDEPFRTRLGNQCPSAPWQRSTRALPLSCQAELSNLLLAYHGALNNDRVSVLRCVPPASRVHPHSIVRLNRAPAALTQYENRVGPLANLMAYEGVSSVVFC